MKRPLQPATNRRRPPVKDFIKTMMDGGATRQQAKDAYADMLNDEIWCNDEYVVIVYRGDRVPPDVNPEGWAELVWLSIRRQDRGALIDWRDLQEIKNQLVGEECDAVQIFPAESRLVDEANQFHLWCRSTPGRWIPFGFNQRLVSYNTRMGRAKQRPLTQEP